MTESGKPPSTAKYFWRATGYFVVLAVINLVAHGQLGDFLAKSLPSWLATVLESIAYLLGVLALTWVFCRFLDHSSLTDLGLQKRGWFAKLAAGWGLGVLLMLVVFGILVAGNWVTIERAPWQPLDLAAVMMVAVVVGFNEELAFRGYIMQRLGQALGMPLAVAGSSILFGLVHLVNPNATVLGVLSICLSGLLYACAYLVTRSLWLPMGLHMSWNIVQMHILGFPGSGHVRPSILRSITHGPDLVTGGAFGPEGGIVVIGPVLVAIALLLFRYRTTLTKD